MNFLDLIALLAIGYGAIKGFFNGMVKEIIGFISVILALWIGMRIAFLFADYYKGNAGLPDRYIPFLAFLSAFLLVLVAILLLARLIDTMVSATALTVPNKLGGAAFGGLKLAFLVGALFCVVGHANYLPEETKNSSATYKPLTEYVSKVNEYSFALLPGAKNVFAEMKTYFSDIAEKTLAADSIPETQGKKP